MSTKHLLTASLCLTSLVVFGQLLTRGSLRNKKNVEDITEEQKAELALYKEYCSFDHKNLYYGTFTNLLPGISEKFNCQVAASYWSPFATMDDKSESDWTANSGKDLIIVHDFNTARGHDFSYIYYAKDGRLRSLGRTPPTAISWGYQEIDKAKAKWLGGHGMTSEQAKTRFDDREDDFAKLERQKRQFELVLKLQSEMEKTPASGSNTRTTK